MIRVTLMSWSRVAAVSHSQSLPGPEHPGQGEGGEEEEGRRRQTPPPEDHGPDVGHAEKLYRVQQNVVRQHARERESGRGHAFY